MYNDIWYKILMFGLEFIGKYYSSYRGFVVDNVDPEGLNRIKVTCPTINSNDNEEGVWAYPKGSWGGNNYGVNLLPQKADMVWLEFEQGDLDFPMWSMASFGEKEKPEEFSSPNIYGFKTPAGSIVLIDDTEEKESILVKLKGELEYINIEKEILTLEAKQILLGKDGDEKAVLGDTLKNKLDQILDAINTHTHTSSTGPTGVPINVTTFTGIKDDIATILSDKVKIDK